MQRSAESENDWEDTALIGRKRAFAVTSRNSSDDEDDVVEGGAEAAAVADIVMRIAGKPAPAQGKALPRMCPAAHRGCELVAAGRDLDARGRYEESAAKYSEALRAFEEAGDAARQAVTLSDLGLCREEVGDVDAAMRLYRKAERLIRKTMGSKSSELARVLDNMACILANCGELDEAVEMETEALGIVRVIHGVHHPDYAALQETIANMFVLNGAF